MPLIFQGNLNYGYSQPLDASNYYIKINRKYLSGAYKLESWDEIYGIITEIRDLTDGKLIKIPEMVKREIKFILQKEAVKDTIYLSEIDWRVLREYGILGEEVSLIIILKRAVKDALGKKIPIQLYTKRDLDLTKNINP